MDGSGTMTMASGAGLPRSNGAGFEDWLFPETESSDSYMGNGSGSGISNGNGNGNVNGNADRMMTMMDVEMPWNVIGAGETRDADSSSATSSAGSPLDQFSTLFDTAAAAAPTSASAPVPAPAPEQVASADAEGLGVRVANSGRESSSETPTPVKCEDTGLQQLPLESLDGFADLEQAVGPDAEAPGNALGSSGNLAARKRRAPRKRLTAHQKEAHNKIEKRYRININTKISKLQQIIPWVASEETAFDAGDSKTANNGVSAGPSSLSMSSSSASASSSSSSSSSCNYGAETACYASDPASAASVRLTDATTPKLNKSMILEKAVDYILYLQNNERLYEMEVLRLKRELERARREKDQD
ncbi:LAFA_0C09538g1_1 [Lachancea sp. 'fantastica']|nr:LAFA_0C09538g1_1 [Lachancea sp. 'fantastica']